MIFFRHGVDELAAAAVSQVELRNGATGGLQVYEDMTGKDIVTVSAPTPADSARCGTAVLLRGLTFDMSGWPLASPLDGRVRRRVRWPGTGAAARAYVARAERLLVHEPQCARAVRARASQAWHKNAMSAKAPSAARRRTGGPSQRSGLAECGTGTARTKVRSPASCVECRERFDECEAEANGPGLRTARTNSASRTTPNV